MPYFAPIKSIRRPLSQRPGKRSQFVSQYPDSYPSIVADHRARFQHSSRRLGGNLSLAALSAVLPARTLKDSGTFFIRLLPERCQYPNGEIAWWSTTSREEYVGQSSSDMYILMDGTAARGPMGCRLDAAVNSDATHLTCFVLSANSSSCVSTQLRTGRDVLELLVAATVPNERNHSAVALVRDERFAAP